MTVVEHVANPPAAGSLVAGIDTHKQTHHVAVLDHLGRPIADHEFTTTSTGYVQLVEFLQRHGRIDRVGVEGTGSYGAGVARVLAAAGFEVLEVIRQNRQGRRPHGKSDPIDAHNAALSVLAGTDTAAPKSGVGQVESLRILMSERRSAGKAKTQAIDQIHALPVTAPDTVRTTYRALAGDKLLTTLARSRPGISGTDPARVARRTLKRLAMRCMASREETASIDGQLEALVRSVNQRLLPLNGAGPSPPLSRRQPSREQRPAPHRAAAHAPSRAPHDGPPQVLAEAQVRA